MDTKKLFEYEFLLESMRPELSEGELLTTLKNTDSVAQDELEKIASFNVVQGEDGVYLKLTDDRGNQKKLLFLNPIAARSLAATLVQNLSAQGYIEDDIIEVDEADASTLH